MLKQLLNIALVLQAVIILSCVTTTKSSKAIISGSEMTPEWIQYNKESDVNNAPKLVYLATCKKVSGPAGGKKAEGITDYFSLKDDKFYVFVRWKNVFDKHVNKLKVFDPRGVLFKEWDSTYSFSGSSWKLWSYIYIKNAPAARIPGKWTAEIYMDDKLAARKSFSIGDTNPTYKKIVYNNDAPAIAVAKFTYKGKAGDRFAWRMPNYIARMLTVDYPKNKVILPSEVMKYLSLSNIDSLENSIHNIVRSPLLRDLIDQHNVKLIILGSIYDDGYVGETKTFKTYIIDTEKQLVACKSTCYWSSLHDYENNQSQLIKYGSHLIYKKTLKEGKQQFEKLSR